LNNRKTRKHPQYTIEQKNEILTTYFNKEVSRIQLEKQFDIGHSVFKKWVQQYREFGTTVDNRGRGTKSEIPSKGRPKKIDFESMSREELIKYIKSGEDIKKAVAYLNKQNKNIK
jgi:transposase-like protein